MNRYRPSARYCTYCTYCTILTSWCSEVRKPAPNSKGVFGRSGDVETMVLSQIDSCRATNRNLLVPICARVRPTLRVVLSSLRHPDDL